MPSVSERRTINQLLASKGLAQLSDPRALLAQLAMGIKNHEQFRRVLGRVDTLLRKECYETLAPRLSFPARPLAEYETEIHQDAERQRLPIYDQETKLLTPFEPARNAKPLTEIAEQAISDDAGSRAFTLVCKVCTREQTFRLHSRRSATRTAIALGWKKRSKGQLCPECSQRAD